ncbi:MAG: tRNA lysidine(34) synthetase TilS [Pseudomonadota bacterium]
MNADPAGSQAQPFTVQDFIDRCTELSAPKDLAVAVSGGSDSLALLLLACERAKIQGGRVLALTVDHGLRPEAADEAAFVASLCKTLGVDHQTLVWRRSNDGHCAHGEARNARYALLLNAAARAGIGSIVTAHTEDDQAETVLMRLFRGAGVSGVAAIAPKSEVACGAGPTLDLLRPLLSASRASLTAVCKAFDQPYVSDPSNDDHAYERPRLRGLIAGLEAQDITSRAHLAKAAAEAREAAARLDHGIQSAFKARAGVFYRWGGASLNFDGGSSRRSLESDFSGAGFGVADAPLLRAVIHAVSGADYAPAGNSVRETLQKINLKPAATIGGVLLQRSNGKLWIVREPAALLGRSGVAPAPRAPVAPGGKILWDGRFTVENTSQSTIWIGPRGRQAGAEIDTCFPTDQAFESAPAAFDAAGNCLVVAGQTSPTGNANAKFKALCRERFERRVVRFPSPDEI